nr:B3 domain-containing protein Os03g0212300-like [Aegilops tauschii subsp. strangulata]
MRRAPCIGVATPRGAGSRKRTGDGCMTTQSRTHAEGTAREFVVWAAMLPRTWIRLPWSIAREIPPRGPVELWLQHDGCCGQASEAEVEVVESGDVFMTRGWGVIACACHPEGGHAIHFEYDGASTLFFRVFGEDGRRLGCCSGRGGRGGELALGLVSDSSDSNSAS